MSVIKIAQAAENSIVSCTGGDCTICSAMEMLSKTINFLVGISFAAAILVLVVGGFTYIFSASYKHYLEKAKVFVKSGIIGFGIVLVSWILIRTIFFISGSASSWWQFNCNLGEPAASNSFVDSLLSIKKYPALENFILSGEKEGRIESLASESFLAGLNNLQSGEELTFNLPAKNNLNNTGISVPFLAGYEDGNGQIKISEFTSQLIQQLTNEISQGKISLFNYNEGLLTQQESLDIVRGLTSSFKNLLAGNLGNNYPNSDDISTIKAALADLDQGITGLDNNEAVKKIVSPVVNTALEKVGNVIVSAGIPNDRKNNNVTSAENSFKTGDRAQGISGGDRAVGKNNAMNLAKTVGGNGMRNEENAAGNNNNNQNCLDPADQEEGAGEPEDVWRAFRRLHCRDPLRYEMMFRFTKYFHIIPSKNEESEGDKNSGSESQTTDSLPAGHICGPTEGVQIVDIAHTLVHEGTHSGQGRLELMGDYLGNEEGMGKLEAIACANEIGTVPPTTPRIEEFPRQPLEVILNGIRVRGDFARYYDKANPKGDVDEKKLDEEFIHCRDYPIERGLPKDYYSTEGVYPYGWGKGDTLKLAPPEEEVVKKIMDEKGPINCEWGSCPPAGLPKLGVPCNCPEFGVSVDNDLTCKAP